MNFYDPSKEDIISWLDSRGPESESLFAEAVRVRNESVPEGVFLRGLIEYSNVCRKNCLYCGIRKDNERFGRYTLTPGQVLEAAGYAYENNYGSVVIQGGENQSGSHIQTIAELLSEITTRFGGQLGVTLSLGEQSRETYDLWKRSGAHRYLLRIESSNPEIYRAIHPEDDCHRFESRLKALADLRDAGYQVGTGVMIGLPGQTTADLADDLLFMRSMDIDMCGMGPYVVSEGTPFASRAEVLVPEKDRMWLTLKMIASLRILMPTINIAAATALQAIDPEGRALAVRYGANVFMPNITPGENRERYRLYDNKPMHSDSRIPRYLIRYGEKGDSRHYSSRQEK